MIKNNNGANLGFENKLWEMADKLEATIKKNLEMLGFGGMNNG